MEKFIEHKGKLFVKSWCKGDCKTVLLQRRGIAQNFRVDRTGDYADVLIEMRNPDGQISKHHTAMCRACRDRLLSDGPREGELDAIYAQDYYQWIETAVASGWKRAECEQMAARFAGRVALRALDERP